MTTAKPDAAYLCLIPVFNDWESAHRLLAELHRVAGEQGRPIRVLLVDDGSVGPRLGDQSMDAFTGIDEIRAIRLRCNLGHQRAIAVGLSFLASESISIPVVVMDGDGEDLPHHAPQLVKKLLKQPGTPVVFGARMRRLESWRFQALYHLFRLVHRLLTGVPIRFGNFSAIQPDAIQRLTMSPDLWNHYAAAVLHSRLPFDTVPLPKGRRYHGNSQMRFSTLVAHGLSGIAVFNEEMTARLLFACGAAMAVLLSLLVIVVAASLFSNEFTLVGASLVGALLVILVTQIAMSVLVLAFVVLGNRSVRKVIPKLESQVYIDSVETWLQRVQARRVM